jgi:hypothetical protein
VGLAQAIGDVFGLPAGERTLPGSDTEHVEAQGFGKL